MGEPIRNDETTLIALAGLYWLARTKGTAIDVAAATHLAADLGYELKELNAAPRSGAAHGTIPDSAKGAY